MHEHGGEDGGVERNGVRHQQIATTDLQWDETIQVDKLYRLLWWQHQLTHVDKDVRGDEPSRNDGDTMGGDVIPEWDHSSSRYSVCRS